jgi:hypothetical protein
MVAQFRNGYPLKKHVDQIIDECGVERRFVQYCADYGEKKAGILWKAHSIDELLKDFCKLAENYGIQISRSKFHGRIHSIWFKKMEIDECDE